MSIRRFPRCLRPVVLGAALLPAATLAAREAASPPLQSWLGHELGIESPKMIYLGRVPRMAARSDVSDRQTGPRFALRDAPGDGSSLAIAAVNATTGDVYQLVAARSDIDRLHQEMVRRGATSATNDAAATDARFTPNSWSGGIQNFLRLGIADGYAANHDRYRRIGQIGSGCTGTLVGSRHVLTAAHCVVDNETMTAYSTSFRPRRDWTQGTPSPTAPHGSRTFVWYYFPLNYWNGACNPANTGQCNKYDIALGVLSSNMNVPAMGYWYANVSTLNTWNKYMRGYPRCRGVDDNGNLVADPEAPPNCTRSTLYGDSGDCDIGRWASPDADGWNRELYVDCDGARGMSGSAMYTADSPGGLVALGVYSQYLCTAAACEDDPDGEFPNIITRITPEYAGFISMAKSIWNCPSGTCN